MNGPRFGITKLSVRNFRCFDSFSIDFHESLTVIVAKNGGGKTAVLDAIKVAFGTFVGAFNLIDGIRGAGFTTDDARIQFGGPGAAEPYSSYPVSLEVAGVIDGATPVSWARTLASAKAHTTVKDARVLSDFAKSLQGEIQKTVQLPLLAYYGTGRLWQVKKLTGFKKVPSTRLAGYLDALDPASSFKAFAEWFKVLSASVFEEKWREGEVSAVQSVNSSNSLLLSAVNQAVSDVLADSSGWAGLEYSPSQSSIVAIGNARKRLRVDMLSDGIRIMIGLVADIAFRCARLNPHLGVDAARLTAGVVLIDEIDLHLHPEWQQRVLLDLRRAFPLVQFVVTTHSPQVLTSVKPECVRVLDDGHTRNVAFSEGAESSQILEDVMGVGARPPIVIVKKLRDYMELVSAGHWDTETALVLREELDKWGKGSEPELIRADTEIRLKSFLRG